jgi:peptide/nickel transport system substrate-binding protein
VVALVPWDKYRELRDITSTVIARTPGNAYEHVTLNEKQFPPFADIRVRRALIAALDREEYVRTILDGLAPVALGPIQPVSWAYSDRVARHPFDPALARQLLDQAGWKAGADGIREKGGARLAFTLITQAGYAIRENIAQAIERQLRDVGVDVKVELQDGTAISAIWFEGRFEAMLHWWQMPSDPELTTFFAADRTPPAGRNINYFQNEELTKLLYASDRTVDRAQRRELLRQAQKRVAELVPELFLYNTSKIDAVPATLMNFKGNPSNAGPFWNVHEWNITSGAR